MSRFIITPTSISHHQSPVFHAKWQSGLETPEDTTNTYYHRGSTAQDSILLYAINWEDEQPDQEQLNQLMDAAISAIDHWISERF